MIKNIKINKISKKLYKGNVYNIELNSKSEDDDLFWIEQNTGIITHNCFPKDLNAMIARFEDEGLDPKVMKAVWEQNKELRTNWDWATIEGAVSEGN